MRACLLRASLVALLTAMPLGGFAACAVGPSTPAVSASDDPTDTEANATARGDSTWRGRRVARLLHTDGLILVPALRTQMVEAVARHRKGSGSRESELGKLLPALEAYAAANPAKVDSLRRQLRALHDLARMRDSARMDSVRTGTLEDSILARRLALEANQRTAPSPSVSGNTARR